MLIDLFVVSRSRRQDVRFAAPISQRLLPARSVVSGLRFRRSDRRPDLLHEGKNNQFHHAIDLVHDDWRRDIADSCAPPADFGNVMVAHRSTIFLFANRHKTNPWNSIFCPVAASVAVHELRTITLSPSARMSSTVTWRSGQRL
jgi:hypothetical protein